MPLQRQPTDLLDRQNDQRHLGHSLQAYRRGTFLRIKLSYGASCLFARVSLPGKVPEEEDRVEISLMWQEHDEVKAVLKKGLRWMKAKLA